jgi:hypothetical protein
MKLIDKLWNWGHLETSHNKVTKLDCTMTPEEFAEVYGIKNAFIVSYGGNIQPPFDTFAKRFSVLNEVKWSVLGDGSTPLPDAALGNTEDIIAVLGIAENITGGVVDDFFSPTRMERFTPDVLKKIKRALNAKGLDFWCVLYAHQLDLDLEPYLDCFDGVTFWIWESTRLPDAAKYVDRILSLIKGKPLMLGVYLFDYGTGSVPMDAQLLENQMSLYFEYLRNKVADGVIFCSGAVGDADLEANRILKRYIAEYGETEIV